MIKIDHFQLYRSKIELFDLIIVWIWIESSGRINWAAGIRSKKSIKRGFKSDFKWNFAWGRSNRISLTQFPRRFSEPQHKNRLHLKGSGTKIFKHALQLCHKTWKLKQKLKQITWQIFKGNPLVIKIIVEKATYFHNLTYQLIWGVAWQI